MIKTIWISYDLGIGGDYESLYAWLDNNHAIECGDGLACLKISITKDDDDELINRVKQEIFDNVKIDNKSRIYIIRRVADNSYTKVSGKFIYGKRKGNPWDGYGSKDDLNNDDGE